MRGRIPLGLFILPGGEGDVQVNPWLASRLGVPGTETLSQREFWNRIEDLSLQPDRTHRVLEQALSQLKDMAGARFSLQTRTDSHWLIGLSSLAAPGALSGQAVGWVLDWTPEVERFHGQVGLLAEISTRTRMSAAAASGNLAALAGNLAAWDSEVVADFLETAGSQLRRVQGSLDLALSYASLIKGIPLYQEAVDISLLLSEIKGNGLLEGIKLLSAPGDQLAAQRVEIDSALTRLALETILTELFQHNPPGMQIDVLLEAGDGYLTLKLVSPRTLPLPGLDPDHGMEWSERASPRFSLARELLSIQGVSLNLLERPSQDGGGVDIEVGLPLAESQFQGGDKPVLIGDAGPGGGRILLAEDQPDYQLRLREELISAGYRVDLAPDGSTALDMVQTTSPDLMILARNLPGMDGLLVTQGVRRWSDVPILMISGRLNPDDQLYAYRLGVDDYLRKPFRIEELLAKVNVFISRRQAHYQDQVPEIYQSGSVRINHSLRQVWVRGDLVDLTPIEYNLLEYMARHGRQIITYEQLQENVWKGPEKGSRQGLFVHVRRLREKIESDPKEPRIIRNQWGVGYLFTP